MAERFVLDKSDCVDGGDGCKAEMRHSVAGAFVYHSEIEKACAAGAGPRSMPPLQTLYAMFEEWRTAFPVRYRPESGSPETAQLIDAWIAGFAKHNEITCAATASPAPAESVTPEQIVYNVAQRDPRFRNHLIEQLTALGNEQDRGPLRKLAPAERTEVEGEQN